jgi:hypothetical protein
MTVGALIFAHNNTAIDYTKLAVFAADRVKQFLNIPVSIVTDNVLWLETNYPNHCFDKVIKITGEPSSQKLFYDGSISSKKLDWKNTSRYQAYNLTPYDTTVILDSDFVINSDTLSLALQRDCLFQLYKNSFDIDGWRPQIEFQRINQYSIPFYWATVVVFKKDPIVEAFFNLVTYIKTNWLYYRTLYSIESDMFRNDFAFSIAIHIMNGKMNGDFAIELPGKMNFISDRDILVDISDSSMNFLLQKENHLGEYIAAKTSGIDMHVMNKDSLTRVINRYGYYV